MKTDSDLSRRSGHPLDLSDGEKMGYKRFAAILDAVAAAIQPAEAHGLLVGWWLSSAPTGGSGQRSLDCPEWVEAVLGGGEASVDPADREAVERAGRDALAELVRDDYTFEPLLPGDCRPIGLRSRSLGVWCAGFLSGLGLGGLWGQRAWSRVMSEVVSDFTELTRIEPSPEPSEDSEAALAEIVEYIRAGVMLLLEESRSRALLSVGEPGQPGGGEGPAGGQGVGPEGTPS